MAIDLIQTMLDNPQFSKSLRSRTFRRDPESPTKELYVSQEEVDDILRKMSNVMSLSKLSRKIGIMAVVMRMEIGASLSAEQIAERVNEIILPQQSLSATSVGSLMKLVCRWGFIERRFHTSRTEGLKGRYEYIRVK